MDQYDQCLAALKTLHRHLELTAAKTCWSCHTEPIDGDDDMIMGSYILASVAIRRVQGHWNIFNPPHSEFLIFMKGMACTTCSRAHKAHEATTNFINKIKASAVDKEGMSIARQLELEKKTINLPAELANAERYRKATFMLFARPHVIHDWYTREVLDKMQVELLPEGHLECCGRKQHAPQRKEDDTCMICWNDMDFDYGTFDPSGTTDKCLICRDKDCEYGVFCFALHPPKIYEDRLVCYCHSCGRSFHVECLQNWKKTQKAFMPKCPNCQKWLRQPCDYLSPRAVINKGNYKGKWYFQRELEAKKDAQRHRDHEEQSFIVKLGTALVVIILKVPGGLSILSALYAIFPAPDQERNQEEL